MKTLHLAIFLSLAVLIVGSNAIHAQNVTNSASPIPYSILRSASPTLTSSETQSLINVALAIPGLQQWSHDWRYIGMGFLGNNKLATGGFEWQYAILSLKVPSSSAPIPCENDWWAWVDIDMTTMKVVQATYPTMESHNCQMAIGGGPGTVDLEPSGDTIRSIESPLEQFKSGISLEDIQCKGGLFLAISNEKNPLCLGPGTISKLASRGLLYGARQDSETTILIPPGSENPASNKTYSPDVATVVIGINSTITWVNQADAGNSIASDTPVVQNLNTFGSSSLRPGESYRYTFTEPGVFHYHGEPHPWQKGIINVISIPIPATLTAQQPSTTNFPKNNTIFGDFYPGIESNSGIVSIKNQTYYMTTASNTTYPIAHGMTVKFHNVTFSFPYGAQATPGGILIPFDMTFPDGTTETYGNVTKNPDGSGSISGISLGPGPSSNRTVTVQSNHMHPQAGVTLTENQIKLLVSTDGNTTITQTPENDTLPASFEPCQDPYPQNYTGIPVLSMPENSTGKICVRYHNLNDFAAQAGIRVSDADNLTGQASTISTWSDSENNQIPPNQDLTIVYWIKTGDRPGLYGLTMFCAPIPLAVGHGNDSMTASDFPWVGKQFECPMLTYDFHIDSTTGIGVKYIPWK